MLVSHCCVCDGVSTLKKNKEHDDDDDDNNNEQYSIII